MVVILIVGMIARIIIPTINYRSSDQIKKECITYIGGLISNAWQSAIVKKKLHRIWFDLKKNIIKIEVVKKIDESGETFEQLNMPYAKSEYQLPPSLEIKELFVDGINILNQPGIKTETAWFYITSDGLVQPTIINIADRSEYGATDSNSVIGLVVNPFSGQLKTYGTFAKP